VCGIVLVEDFRVLYGRAFNLDNAVSGEAAMRNRVLAIGALVLGLLGFGSGEASAQSIRTFMFVPGVPGGATDALHADWIEVLSLSQGASSTKREVACSDLSVMKYLDRSGPPLWVAAAARQVFSVIHLEIVRTSDTSVVLYDIKLQNARVTSIQTSGSSEFPMESVSFAPQSITLQLNTQGPTGVIIPGTPQTISCQ
jgi:type VI secretion system Hcp family effector